MKKLLKFIGAMVGAVALASCGGGGGDKGTSPFGSGSGNGNGNGSGTSAASIVLSISATTASAAAPATVTAKVLNASGNTVAGQVVNFSTAGSLGTFSANSALTDSSGVATVTVAPAAPTSNGADLIIAKTTIDTATVTGTIGFTVTPGGTSTVGQPSVTVALSSTNVTSSAPATFTATVKDSAGNPVAGNVVTFRTASSGIGGFTQSSALTDAAGKVTTQLTAQGNGADLAIAQSSVGGTLATGSVGFASTVSGSPTTGRPSIALTLSTTSVTTATPATVTAVVKDATGAGVVNQVVKFSTVDGRGSLAVTSALTDATGSASTTLSALNATQSGADQVVASATVNGTQLQASQGFQLTAASVAIASVTADVTPNTLGAYAQTPVQVNLSGTSAGTPVTVSITSACLASGKAVLTPTTATTTTGVASFTYRDNGCGATTASDTLRASITGSASTGSIAIPVNSPLANSIAFVSATPSTIYLKGTGLGESSTVTFRVLDTAGNGLPGKSVRLEPTTLAGGLTLDNTSAAITKTSDANGDVPVLVNSGTVPTPVRIKATLDATASTPTISTVSSNLSIAVGLPAQLSFSLSQGTRNIEGYNVDGTSNTYNVIASDRLGNPVPAGTTINFITEGGQIEATKPTTIDGSGNARATANYLSAGTRPKDGRVTTVAYAIGEESFLDQNGNNIYDVGEPFQNLGNLYLDRVFNGVYNQATDQFIALATGTGSQACNYSTNPLLALDVFTPTIDNTCDSGWSRNAYVRRAIETVLSTSETAPVWNRAPSNLYSISGSSCPAVPLVVGYTSGEGQLTSTFPLFGNYSRNVDGTIYGGGDTAIFFAGSSTYSILVADANPVRLNPVAAGTTIAIAGTPGLTVQLLGGSPVPSSTEVTSATFSVGFNAGTTGGTVTLTFTSPKGLSTSIGIPVFASGPAVGSPATPCP